MTTLEAHLRIPGARPCKLISEGGGLARGREWTHARDKDAPPDSKNRAGGSSAKWGGKQRAVNWRGESRRGRSRFFFGGLHRSPRRPALHKAIGQAPAMSLSAETTRARRPSRKIVQSTKGASHRLLGEKAVGGEAWRNKPAEQAGFVGGQLFAIRPMVQDEEGLLDRQAGSGRTHGPLKENGCRRGSAKPKICSMGRRGKLGQAGPGVRSWWGYLLMKGPAAVLAPMAGLQLNSDVWQLSSHG